MSQLCLASQSWKPQTYVHSNILLKVRRLVRSSWKYIAMACVRKLSDERRFSADGVSIMCADMLTALHSFLLMTFGDVLLSASVIASRNTSDIGYEDILAFK